MHRALWLLALSLAACNHRYPPRLEQDLDAILDGASPDRRLPDGGAEDRAAEDRAPDRLTGEPVEVCAGSVEVWRGVNASGRTVAACKSLLPPPTSICTARGYCAKGWHLCTRANFLALAISNKSTPPPEAAQNAWLEACVVANVVKDGPCSTAMPPAWGACCITGATSCSPMSGQVIWECGTGKALGDVTYGQMGVVTDGHCHRLGSSEASNWRVQQLDGKGIPPHMETDTSTWADRALCCPD